MKVVLRLDYATINWDKGHTSLRQITEKLAGGLDLRWTQKGLNENAPQWSPLGLRYMDNSGYDQAPHKLQVSGVGCNKFAETLPALRDGEYTHFSRLDFAFDVLISREDWKEFIKKAFSASLDSTRQRKRFALTGEGEAMTIYIGNRKGAKYFRIYNKTLEDKHFQYINAETGVEEDVPDGYCVIRYEVELHRHKVVSGAGIRMYDPSPLFDWYYSDGEKWKLLSDTIKQLWDSFGDEILLPPNWNEIEFVSPNIIKILFNKTTEECVELVREKLHDYPHTFDNTLAYIADRFGKYIPYLLADPVYREQIFRSCEIAFGFAPDLIVEAKPQGWNDMDVDNDDDPLPWDEIAGDQIDIDTFYGGGERA